MKKINVLSLLLLFGSTQIDGIAAAANPELLFMLACQSIEKLQDDVQWDSDDMGALHLLDTMNACIQFDAAQQKSLDAAKNTYLYKGVPLDLAKIAAENKALDDRIKTLDHNIKEFMKGGKVGKEVKKVANRREERRDKQAQLKANQAAIKANADAMTVAQTAQASIQVLREKNALQFEDAIESYIALYGQCYSSGSMWGSSTVISSKYDRNIAITPNEYAQLVATLQNAVAPFGKVTLELSSDEDIHVNINQVLGFLANMKPASNRSWAQFGINVGIGAAIAAGAIVAVGAASNAVQGKNLLDTEDASALISSAMNSSAGQAFANSMEQANVAAQTAYNNVVNNQGVQYAQNAAQQAYDNMINSSSAKAIQNNYLSALAALGYASADSGEAARESLIENTEQNGIPAPEAAVDVNQSASLYNRIFGN